MRISELARRSGTPLATVKFYLRDGLLHAGVRTSATQAEYDESHLWRLRLVRALVDNAGLSLAQVRVVLSALGESSLLEAARVAHEGLARAEGVDPASGVAALQRLGWQHHPDSAAVAQLAQGLDAAQDLGCPIPDDLLRVYADAAHRIATAEVYGVNTESIETAVTEVVVGTVLFEPILLALRRCAQAAVSQQAWREL